MVLRKVDPSEVSEQSTQNPLPYPTSPTSARDSFTDPHNGVQPSLEQRLDNTHLDTEPLGKSKDGQARKEAISKGPKEDVEVPKPLNIRKSRDMTGSEASQTSLPSILQMHNSTDMLSNEHSQPLELPSILQVHKPSNSSATNTPSLRHGPSQSTFELDSTFAQSEKDRADTNPFLEPRSSDPQENANPAAIYQDEQLANPFRQDSQDDTTLNNKDSPLDTTSNTNEKAPDAIISDAASDTYGQAPGTDVYDTNPDTPYKTDDSTMHDMSFLAHETPKETLVESIPTTNERQEPLQSTCAPGQAEQPPLIPVEHHAESTNSFPNQGTSHDVSHHGTSHATLNEPFQDPYLWGSKHPDPPAPHSPPPQTSASEQPTSNLEASRRKASQQRNEVYQIRHIRWFDENYKKNPRKSPILVQNANGPCPLLALVNALILTTPPDFATALVETLKTREQVSLGLLLDAVFDELTSGRRGATAQLLPDVADLYSFLVTLHTGMNVNPRFTHPRFNETLSSSAGLDQDQSSKGIGHLGGFEETREMRLYSSFAIPLIHGWLPEREASAYQAFDRIAQTYEETQNIQFREEELEQKMQEDSLTAEEEGFFLDLTTIKEFMNTWPTQLTDHGLRLIKQTLKPGQISILFRNDHFSTLYKEPRSGQLMTLVTDAGYATHDEIVWENLVDISGMSSELFSGDFKSVSHNATAQQQGWNTAQARNQNQHQHQRQTLGHTNHESRHQDFAGHPSNDQEQEDRDLALAMQLQEEEEQRDREARQRQQHQETQGRQQSGPEIPPRRNQGHPPRDGNALPSYEESKNDRPFHSSPRRGGHRQQGSGGFGRGSAMPVLSPGNNGSSVTGQQAQPGGRGRRARQTLIEQIPSSTPADPQAQGGQNLQANAAPTQNKKDNCIVM
ncbi:MAG: hypothetical protein M1831_006825 [Alyxoria varia]|nr:MAG: hypothetical protein M1831_006825 [Alyxoria varia]